MNPTVWAVAFAIVFPSLVTLAYFVWLSGAGAAKQAAYAVGKLLQFGFPVAWLWCMAPATIGISWPGGRGVISGVVSGLLFGLLVAVGMGVLYWGWLKPAGLFDGRVREEIVAKLRGFGLTRLWRYAALGVFYALGHSLLEEYYWRWFVFGNLRHEVASLSAAIAIASLGFTAHHVILLGVYFGWTSAATLLFSIAVAIGGAVWAWLYFESGSLAGPWLSHLLVDAAIFTIGYDVAKEEFG